MQIYASYNYRRDLADVVRIPGFLGRSRQLGREEARQLQVGLARHRCPAVRLVLILLVGAAQWLDIFTGVVGARLPLAA